MTLLVKRRHASELMLRTLEVLARPPTTCAEATASLLDYTRRMRPDYVVAPFHERIAAALGEIEARRLDRLVITMPPRHGQSTLAYEHFPPWYLGRNPDRRIIATSYAAALAHRFSRRARNLLMDRRSPFAVRPALDLASVQAWDLADRRGGYVAAGIGGAITGLGADVLLVDDPVKSAEAADSPTYRERAWEWFTQTAIPRLEPGGAIVLIGTRWHTDDLIGRALTMDGVDWTRLDLPALDETGAALWPERYDVAALERIRRQVGERAFAALYQQRPAPAEGGLFKRAWWQRYAGHPPLERVETFVDSAFKDGVANDYTVFATWGSDGLGTLYLLDLWRGRVEFPELIAAGRDVAAKQRARFGKAVPLVVEDKASGQSAIQTWRRPYPAAHGRSLPALPVVAYPIPAGSTKVSRAQDVTPLVEGQRVRLPLDAPWVEAFIEEHAAFPTGTHDDQVDTTAMALTRLSQRPAGGSVLI
jgi:predicted phage terminase large subunit-like protein